MGLLQRPTVRGDRWDKLVALKTMGAQRVYGLCWAVRLRSMAFTPEQLSECVRDQVDLRAEIKKTEILLVHRRRIPGKEYDSPIAKVRWIAARRVWILYWMRANFKWLAYETERPLLTIGAALDEVDHDSFGCFFG